MTIYIVHGYGASPSAHWFPWLKTELEKIGAHVSILELPLPSAPQADAWNAAIARQVGRLDAQTYFVAHSLGGIALLRYLSGLGDDVRIGGYLLVSGFNESLPGLPQLDGFIDTGLPYDQLRRVAGHRAVVAAADDLIVPFRYSESLSTQLDARFVPLEHGGHFLGSDGFTRFPQVLELIKEFIRTDS